MALDVRWLNPFVVGALTVLRSFGIEASRGGPIGLQQDNCTTEPITVIVPVTGELEGAVLYGMATRTAVHIGAAMIGDLQKIRWDEELLQSALAEFGNMVTGHAAGGLEEAGVRCTIGVPVVVLEARLIVAQRAFERLVVPVETSYGPLQIHLALRDRGTKAKGG